MILHLNVVFMLCRAKDVACLHDQQVALFSFCQRLIPRPDKVEVDARHLGHKISKIIRDGKEESSKWL